MNKPTTHEIVKSAFFAVHNGRSTDDIVINDELNRQFIAKCKESLPNAADFDLNWCLLNLRKRSSLGRVVTSVHRKCHDAYVHAAEIAARHLEDTHETSVDRILCDPSLRAEFDVIASELAMDVDKYLLRKAALKLRKGRQLKPELIKRVADWGTEIMKKSARSLQDDPSQIPKGPGVYLFFDSSGYLYIGEASNLKTRVSKHLDHSDRKALARYLWKQGIEDLWVELHCFDANSNGRLVGSRRAYEASLIQSRKPRFNIK